MFCNIYKNFESHVVHIKTGTKESIIRDFYDNYSSDMKNYTHYYACVDHYVGYDILGGGSFLLEGFKRSNDYEYQEAKTYSSNGMQLFTRSKSNGTWTSWANKS